MLILHYKSLVFLLVYSLRIIKVKIILLNLVAFILISFSNAVVGSENIDYHNNIISDWCADSNYTFECGNNISIIDLKKDNVSEGNASANDLVEQEHPYETLSFESPKKFIKTLKDILKDEIPKDKIDFTLKPFNASDKGSNYKNIKTLKKALPLGSKEIIRSVKELNIDEGSELRKSLQKEIYQIALRRASGESLSEIKKPSSKGNIGLGLLGVAGAVAVAAGGSSDKPAALPSLSISTSTSAIAESGGTSTIAVTLSKAVDVDTEVTIAYNSTASVGVDFSSPLTVSIPAGETSATFTITAIDDGVYEGDETSIIKISSVDNSSINISSSNSVTITITEDEVVPTVSLQSSGNSIAEESGNSITFTASIDQVASVDLSVTISTTVNSRSRAYTANLPTSISITVPAGSLSGTATFTPTDNNSYDGTTNVSFAVSSVAGSGAVGNTINIHSSAAEEFIGIIEAESAPTVSLSDPSTSVAEDGPVITLTATLTGSTYTDTIVVLGGSGTATNTSDYTIANITIAAGETSGTASFTPIEDDLYEGDETAIVSISTVSGGGATESGDQSVTITITDADSAPTVTLSSDVTSVAEDGSAITLTATLSNKADEAVTVPITTFGTATEGTDYATISDITIAAGATTGTASITPTDDNVSEGIETLVVSLGTLSGADATAGSTSSISLNLVDDDVPNITLTTSAASIAENSSSSLTLTATTSMVATEDIVVTLGAAGTATSGTDYTALPSTVTIAAGETTATTSFTPKDDALYDAASNETAIISITNVAGGNALESGDQSVTLTITDNESAPTVTLATSATSVAENGSDLTLTATLSVASYADVIVTLTGSGTSTAGTDYASLSTITISAGSTTGSTTFSPTGDDSVYEGSETAIVAITNVAGGATESGDQSVTITITDADSAPTVTLSSDVTSVAEDGGTAIITATLSKAVEATVQITLSSSGTSIEGVDYVNLSQIIIGQGDTTAYVSLKPIEDTLYENSETVVISIHTILGGDVFENGVQEISLIIIDEELDSGTQAIYNSSNESVWLIAEEFSNSDLNAPSADEDDNPYKNINLHKALSYEDENGDPIIGTGKLISIIDSGFQVKGFGNNVATHTEFIGKTILNADPDWFTTYQNNNEHGTAVAGVAAGNFGSGLSMGVAPGANLHLFDYYYADSYHDTFPEYWAEGVRDAAEHGAVVQNNSWGFDDSQSTYNASANITNYVSYMNNNNVSGAQTLSDFYDLDTDQNGVYDINFGGAPEDWQEYIDALDEFQKNGVVVFALSNNTSLGDADVSAALPELFPDLKEAWITVANVDIYDAIDPKYWHVSAPCGSTAEYCLAADGAEIFMPGYSDVTTDDGFSYGTQYGTSFAAPQVSGAIALLSSHFPNHSPEALTDRLLASANNNIEDFEQIGSVTFGNGVVHGYSNDAGHGILDIYAALQPIVSSSYTQNQIYAGSKTIGKSSFNLNFSTASISRSFGDAIEIGLANTNTYFYDALDGGFAVGMNDLAFSLNPAKPSLSVKSELSNLTSVSNKFLHFENTGWSESSDDRKGFFNASVSSSPSALNNFYLNTGAADLGFASYSMPTLAGIQGGDGFNLGLNMGEGFLTTSITQTNISNNLDNEVQSSFITSYQQEISKDLTYSLMFGLADEGSKFLGMTGGGAFDLEGSKSNTSLAGAKIRFGVGEMSSIGFMAAISKSELSENNQGFVTGIDNVTADTFALSFDTFNVFGNDKLSVSLSQPHRVNSGTMGMQIAGLTDSDGNIPYTYHDIGLTPSGRQVDLSIGYSKDILENTTIGARFIHTKEAGHVKSAQDENSIFAGITYKNLNLGGLYVDVSNRVEAEINYTIRW